jgi:SPP1 gp7 family putative phage head morphogenesis protein
VSWRVPGQYSEAVEWFRQRVPMLEGEFASLDAAAKRKAFTVAGVAQLDMVHQVWQALDKALADGTTFEEFKATVGQRLAVAWGKPNPARLETIFRTNMQLAYGAGRYRQLTDPDVLETRPYWMYDAVLDSRTSSLCKRLDKTVLRHDDPFWKSHIPPLHHRCRSGLRSLTAEQAQARGVTESPPDEQASEGFGLAPDVGEWQPNLHQYPAQLSDIFLAISHDHQPAQTPPSKLPLDVRVKFDGSLRYNDPKLIASDAMAWLRKFQPANFEIPDIILHTDETAFARDVLRAISDERQQSGLIIPEPTRLPRAFSSHTQGGQIYLGPRVVADLQGDIAKRARGWATIAHEYWHGIRRSPLQKTPPIEEGLAQEFALRAAMLRLGWQIQVDVYQQEWGMVQALLGVLEQTPSKSWRVLQNSRQTDNLRQWLWDELIKRDFSPAQAKKLLGYTLE